MVVVVVLLLLSSSVSRSQVESRGTDGHAVRSCNPLHCST